MTILIKNGQIIDGSGGQSYKADVFTRNGLISAIGNLGNLKADKIIAAANLYIAPGFIDCNTDSDHHLTLFSNPEQQDFIAQGVTTILGGTCGSSLAPIMYGSLKSIRKWTDVYQINVDWHTVGEFLSVLERKPLGVNFGTLMGHSTIRRDIIGDVLRDLTLGELDVFKKTLDQGMKEGALGLSTGLAYVHSRGTPQSEIKNLLEPILKNNGIYTTHLRNESIGLLESINETIQIAEETKITTIINHFRPIKGYEAEFEKALYLISQSSGEADIYFDVYPYEKSHVQLYSLLPLWAQNGSREVMIANLKNESARQKIIAELPSLKGEDIEIATAQEHAYFVGKSLKDFSENRNLKLNEGLLALMEATELKATVYLKNIDYDVVAKAMLHERALISSNSASFASGGVNPDRKNTFKKFLDLVLKNKDFTLEEAIAKITSLPAQTYRLLNRGYLKVGHPADMVVFSADPGSGTEIQHVLINGTLAMENKILLKALNGKVLKRAS